MLNNQIIFGGDYNPEQWPEEVWQDDVELMQQAGVNLVSLGIFSWARLEPEPGRFDFEWLDKIIDLLYQHGVSVNLATPTASPPAWLVKLHPEILPVNEAGETLWHGGRRHYCPHCEAYKTYTMRIANIIATRYKNCSSIKMWHIDNEYGCHIGECFCDQSAIAFRDWLQKRYQTIDQLNAAWGTAFWGQIYSAWDEIIPPRKAPTFANPTQQLDWKRFNSDSWIQCFLDQKQILNSITPDIPVTTNFMGFHPPIDYFKFAAQEDIVSNDNYPDTYDPEWMIRSAMICDLMRSIGNSKPWILMEQATSHVNWRTRNSVKKPGVMRIGSYQALARGADGIMFFQWRASKAGAEKHHSGMIPHAGTKTRTWNEVKTLGNELKLLGSIANSQVKSDAAILFDWNNWWALNIDSKPSNEFDVLENMDRIFQYFYKRNIPIDFVHPEEPLDKYKFIIVPNLYLVTDATVQNVDRYTNNGGVVLMTYFSGIVDENEQIRLGGYPAPFKDMLGIKIDEFVPYETHMSNSIQTMDQQQFGCSFWSDIIQLNGAASLAVYENDFYSGTPALTVNNYGKGTAYYCGTELDHLGLDWLLQIIQNKAGVKSVHPEAPSGVEIIKREMGEKAWLFILNFNETEVEIRLEQPGYSLLNKTIVDKTVRLSGNGVDIIELPHN